MIVVDASLTAKLVLREEGWERVLELLRREEAYTVDHALKEVLNAVWKACRPRRLISMEEAQEKLRILELLAEKVVIVEEETRYLREAFRIALETGLTLYDSLYVAQAAAKRATIATSDAKQAEAARQAGVEVLLTLWNPLCGPAGQPA